MLGGRGVRVADDSYNLAPAGGLGDAREPHTRDLAILACSHASDRRPALRACQVILTGQTGRLQLSLCQEAIGSPRIASLGRAGGHQSTIRAAI